MRFLRTIQSKMILGGGMSKQNTEDQETRFIVAGNVVEVVKAWIDHC